MSKIIKGLIDDLKGMSESEATVIIAKAVESLDALNTESKTEITTLKDTHTTELSTFESKVKELESATPEPQNNDKIALLQKELNEFKAQVETEKEATKNAERKADLVTIESKLIEEFKSAGATFPELLVKEHIEKFRLSDDQLLSGEDDNIIDSKSFVEKHKSENERYYSAIQGGGSGNPANGGQQQQNTNPSWADVAADLGN